MELEPWLDLFTFTVPHGLVAAGGILIIVPLDELALMAIGTLVEVNLSLGYWRQSHLEELLDHFDVHVVGNNRFRAAHLYKAPCDHRPIGTPLLQLFPCNVHLPVRVLVNPASEQASQLIKVANVNQASVKRVNVVHGKYSCRVLSGESAADHLKVKAIKLTFEVFSDSLIGGEHLLEHGLKRPLFA